MAAGRWQPATAARDGSGPWRRLMAAGPVGAARHGNGHPSFTPFTLHFFTPWRLHLCTPWSLLYSNN